MVIREDRTAPVAPIRVEGHDLKALEKEWKRLAGKARWEQRQKNLGRVSEETQAELRLVAVRIARAEGGS